MDQVAMKTGGAKLGALVLIASLLLTYSEARSGDYVDQGWWNYIDGNWCYRTKDREFCFPRDFGLEQISGHKLRFSDRSGRYQTYFARFETHEEGEDPNVRLVAENFVVVGAISKNGINITEYAIDNDKEPNLEISLFSIRFDPSSVLLLHGRFRNDIKPIVESIVDQWADERAQNIRIK